MSEGLKIVIGADVGQGIAGVNKFNDALTKTGGSMSRIGLSSNTAAFALQNLGRVSQDAPFGFIAIQNNINPLLESFQRLKTETGSTKGALSALASSLIGGGGLGLAISAGTALLTLFAQGFFKTGAATKEATTDATRYRDTLDGIGKSISEDATRVATLVGALQSQTLSHQQTKGAIDELIRISPDYFQGLKDEKGLVEKVTVAYQGYIGALKQQFQAQALKTQLQKLFDKKLELEVALDPKLNIKNNTEFQNQKNAIEAELKTLPPIDWTKITDITKLTPVQQKVVDLQQRLQSLNNVKLFDLTGQSAELSKIDTQIEGLLRRIQAIGNFDIHIPPPKIDPKSKDEDPFADLHKKIEAARVGLFNGLRSLGVDAHAQLAGAIDTSLAVLSQPLRADNFLDSAITKVELITDMLKSKLAPAFAQTFQSIIQGGGNMVAALGSALKQVISKLVAAAVTAVIFAAVISIATGGKIEGGAIAQFAREAKSIFSSLSGIKFAKGGIATQATFGTFGEAGPEAIIPLKDINKVMRSIGGSGGGQQVFIVENRLEGATIVQAYRRASNQLGGTFS